MIEALKIEVIGFLLGLREVGEKNLSLHLDEATRTRGKLEGSWSEAIKK